ncbi:unnamed protein product [Sphagnum balticum]
MEFHGAPRLMIVSDLDNTMVDHQDHENKSLLRFDALWEAEYNHDSLLVFSTGRSPHLYFELRSHVPLLTPGIAIMSVGTEIKYGESMVPDHGWEQELNEGWDRDAIVEEATKLNLKFQVESEQRPHKVSFYVEKKSAQEVLATLNERFKARGLNPKLIYSGGVDLDILPQGAGKGQALAYLMRKFKAEGRTPGHTLVCGDSGNDAELFAVADVSGVIVGNAQEELLQWHAEHAGDKSHIFLATERCASGILEAMKHFDLQPYESPRDHPVALSVNDKQAPKIGAVAAAHEVVEYLLLIEQWLRGDVPNSHQVHNRLKSVLAPDSSLVHAYGIISNPYKEIDSFHSLYGSQKGKTFAIWADRIRTMEISDDSWVVRFDKWQRTGLTFFFLCLFIQANVDTPNGLQWKLIHETWLSGYSGAGSNSSA